MLLGGNNRNVSTRFQVIFSFLHQVNTSQQQYFTQKQQQQQQQKPVQTNYYENNVLRII